MTNTHTTTTSPPISTGRICAWMLRYPLRRKLALSAVLGSMLAGSALRVLSPWPMKLIVDNVVEGKLIPEAMVPVVNSLPGARTSEGLLIWCVCATIVLFVFGWLVGLGGAVAGIALGQRMIYDLAGDLFDHLQRLSMRFHGSRSVGDLIRRVTSDCGCVATIVRDALLPVVSSVVTLVMMFGVMYAMSPALALVSLAVVPLMVLTFRHYASPMLQRGYAQQEADAKIYGIVEQALYAIPLVQAFGAEPRNTSMLRQATAATLDATLDATRVQVGFKIVIGLATAVGTAGIIALGSKQVLDGTLTTGALLVFLAYLGLLYAPINALMYTGSTIQTAAGSARRIVEVFQVDQEVRDAPDAIELSVGVQGRIEFRNVSVRYDPKRPPALRNLSLSIEPGSCLAIVGPSGAGKSTLASLIPRFFDPAEGTVLLDGRDLRELKLASLRTNVAVVLQEPFLFPISIAQNIAYGSPHATGQQIESAAVAAGADAFIRRLPLGYDTIVAERGASLSGGERQRLSIARALLKDAPVLILDEPTASLDVATEASLIEALQTLMRGRTTIVIAHRLSTVRHADCIVVLDRGEIVEIGTHQQLLDADGLYARLCRFQLGGASK